MKKYYSDKLLPVGYREESDEELRERLKRYINESPKKQEIIICRMLLPLKDDEIVFLTTLNGEVEMAEAHKAYADHLIELQAFCK